MIDKNRLEQKCSMWNIALTGEQLDQLDAFAQILVDYNQKVNLTAITDPEGIEDKHFLDSLLFASQPEVAGKMVDVGAGAGFPGIVTKIYKPELRAQAAGHTARELIAALCQALPPDQRPRVASTEASGVAVHLPPGAPAALADQLLAALAPLPVKTRVVVGA